MNASMHGGPLRRPARGLGTVAIIVVLVAMSALAAAIVRMGQAEQATATRDLLSQRAMQAARAGMEWGLYQAFKGSWTSCSSATQTLDLGTDYGLHATVQCDSRSFNEGESAPGTPRTIRVFTIDVVACNAAACPSAAAAAQPGYVERRRQVQAVN